MHESDHATGGVRWSIVIPTRGRSERLLTTVASVAELISPRDEILVVVDNATMSAGAMPAAGVRVVPHAGRRGFAAACNAGARRARGAYLLFVNDDVMLVDTDALSRLEDALRTPGVALAGPDVWSERLGRSESDTEVFWHHGVLETCQGALASERTKEVAYVCGAALAVRRDRFVSLGGFDERFCPYYWEDVDLALRARAHGGRAVALPMIRARHRHGATISDEPEAKRRTVYERNRLLVTWRALRGTGWLSHLAWLPLRFAAQVARHPAEAASLPLALRLALGRRAREDEA